jgi:hypothetical protein
LKNLATKWVGSALKKDSEIKKDLAQKIVCLVKGRILKKKLNSPNLNKKFRLRIN